MFVLRNDVVFYVDVDDTLAMWSKDGTNWEPNEEHIRFIKQCYRRGQPIVVWSAGGHLWAEQVVKALKLERYVSAVLPKPYKFIDDLPSRAFMPEVNRIFLPNKTGRGDSGND